MSKPKIKMENSFMVKSQLRYQRPKIKKKMQESLLKDLEKNIIQEVKEKDMVKKYAKLLANQNRHNLSEKQIESLHFVESKKLNFYK